MPHPLDKATADGHNVDGGLKAIGLTNQRETPSFGANPLDFLSTKLSSVWMLAPVPSEDAVKDAIKKGDAIFGTIDTWLIWNMTGGVNGGLHVTDVTNVSRTMLMNLKTLSCDEYTLKTLGIPAEILPRL
ncbi:BnaC09g21940D [Brassica napus]|uniref:BnaC09g21940D protein n=1 Tax=Brassica napus TaxID=3708 RepID=A0A078H8B4_BRANA|nr:BnaC09g21940D [Brassica napus]